MVYSKRKEALKGETTRRLKPKAETLRKLFLLSGNECAMKNCKTVLIDRKGTMVGEVAHIAAAMPDGERFDPQMTNEERREFKNLMLLCASHHAEVDGKGSGYSVVELRKIKAKHEKRFHAAENTILKRFETQFPDATDEVSPTKPRTFTAYQEAVGDEYLADGDVEVAVRDFNIFVEKLAVVPPKYRDFMCSIIKRCDILNTWQFALASVPCDDVESALGISARKLKTLADGLERYGIGGLNEDADNRWTVDLVNPSDLVGWADIITFCKASDINLEYFAIDVQFGKLD